VAVMNEKITSALTAIKETGNQFLDKDFEQRSFWLNDTLYGLALNSIVIACVDIVVVCKGKIILGKRINEPWPSYWIMGGRMLPGETFEEAAQRETKTELGLDVDSSRFSYIDTYNFVWSKRQQEPKDHGSHCVLIAMILEISGKELKKVKFDKKQYSSIKLWAPEEILQAEYMHPAIKKITMKVVEFLLLKSTKEELNF
jgi:ADP-ribose pyrophosphatase YjhB (NUDIX family)